MKEKIKNASLCRGALLIRRLTVPMIVAGLLYIAIYAGGLDGAQMLSRRDALWEMIETILSAAVCSFCGIFVFDIVYRSDGEER